MTSRDFCYWLQGWFELNKTIDHREGASKETMDMIEKHLKYVFTQGDLSPKSYIVGADPAESLSKFISTPVDARIC